MEGETGRENVLIVQSKSPEDTEELGVAVGKMLSPGAFLFLSGNLGGGKTLFARGISRGLDCEEPATSPSFALLHRYEGRIPFYHLDLYRLSRPEDTEVLALDELLEEEAVVAVEWGDVAQKQFPTDLLKVQFNYGEKENEREIIFRPFGEKYRILLKELAKKCGF